MKTFVETSMGLREWGMLVTLSLLWGGSFFFVEVAITQLAPLTIVFFRVSLAALALWIFAFYLGLEPPTGVRIWSGFLFMALFNNIIPFSLIVWGQTHIASGLASILNATTPLFTVILAAKLLEDEKPTASKAIGVLAGFAGVMLVIGPQALEGVGSDLWGQLAILAAALSYAFAGVLGRRLRGVHLNPVLAAAGQVTVSSFVMAPIVLYLAPPWEYGLPSLEVATAMLALALLSTAVAYVLYFRILTTAGATNLLLVTFLIPISAILLGSFVLGESLVPRHFWGLGLLGIGLTAVDGRLWGRSNTLGASAEDDDG